MSWYADIEPHTEKSRNRGRPKPNTRTKVRAVNLTSNAAMNGLRESDSPIVPEKLPNKSVGAPIEAEGVEERGLL